ncbi:4a-hydroxytetrahydrobiopterin dehydratase [Ketobacter sp.]|uniref:4a-hydroxytetrahydrobiopterin dehydratase n=1 Tax=Ketobacter sp. TaxID=2083498 RepID=UPI000F0DF967|nr:4a-hydroxytetrahydrobiopterin dehydratase [Ketobacter sp.]RLT92105.1 MAG: 4a-hydroxytetrahydrobiopterin dehydratase [Ketobacter sp.]
MDLKTEVCEACGPGARPATAAEAREWMAQLPQWQQVVENGMPKLQRVFRFADFAQALAFTNRVGALAEQFDHHPALLTEWGQVTVSWWTHSLGGLHRNDFILAARTDDLV